MNIGRYEAEKLETATLRRSSATTGATALTHNVKVRITQGGKAATKNRNILRKRAKVVISTEGRNLSQRKLLRIAMQCGCVLKFLRTAALKGPGGSTRDHIEDHSAIDGIGEIIFAASHQV